jgi:hypothetical protein
MAEGVQPLQRFVGSYARHPAGVEHDLVVIYKGYSSSAALSVAKDVFSSTPHLALEIADRGFDIGAYLAVVPRLQHDYLCFMNTFTEIEADGWLVKLYRHASSAGVGIAGAMGSYESLSLSSYMIHKVLWLCNEAGVPYDERMAYYFDFIIDDHCKRWKAGGEALRLSSWLRTFATPRQLYRQARTLLAGPVKSMLGRAEHGTPEERFQRRWESRIAPGGDMCETARFPAFPNPHIRSNGFMVARERMLEFPDGSVRSKIDACTFESGLDSLTSRVRREGMAAVVVGNDGVGYDVQDWWRSRTFRCLDESNLLLSDNQSRMFSRMTPGAKATHLRITWGDYLGSAPAGFPDLGFRFPVNLAITDTRQLSREATVQR